MKFTPPSRAACTLGLALLFVFGTSLLAQQLASTRASNAGDVAKKVVDVIQAEHISKKTIDDRISELLVGQFLKMLDGQKMYLLQSDIDTLMQQYQTRLDDDLKAGNVEFALKGYAVYSDRLKKAISLAHQYVDAPHDFTLSETMETDAKSMRYAASEQELSDRWRKRVKYDLLLMKLDKTADAEARTRLHKRYKTIQDTMLKLEPDEITEMYLTALCESFDPHSNYMSPRTLEDFRISMELSLEGIGASLKGEDGYTIVNSLVPGGAAALDGRLKVGDKIIGVSNEKGEIVDVVEMKLTKVVDYIRGKRGTKVRLQVLVAATGETKIYELTRQKVELHSSEVKGELIDTSKRLPGTKANIAVIDIPSFYRDFRGAESRVEDYKSTARDLRKELRRFNVNRGGVDAVIIDLRTNGGGALTEAIEVSGLFIEEGPVVQVKDKRLKVRDLIDEDPTVEYKGPLVVITNRLSASASEIFAGVIKDYSRGIIVGDKTTHGKGTVQSVINVGRNVFFGSNQGAVKLTVQQFYRANGESTQRIGVPSDVALPSLLDNLDLGEQFLDRALAFDKVDPLSHAQWNMTNPDIVRVLRDRSAKRVVAVADFQKVQADIEKYLERKKRNAVSLNEEQLRQERVAEEQKTRDKAELPSEERPDGPVFPDNAYNNEVLSITIDYINALSTMKTAKKN